MQNENQRLPTVISVFLAEATLIIIEPGNLFFKIIFKF